MLTVEIVRTQAGHHARLRAENGEIVWTTEVYTRPSAAYNAVALLNLPRRPAVEVDER